MVEMSSFTLAVGGISGGEAHQDPEECEKGVSRVTLGALARHPEEAGWGV